MDSIDNLSAAEADVVPDLIGHPTIAKSWRANWQRIIPFFAYPEEIRRIIYTTNAIESLNNTLKKTTKNRATR